jgi:hypothetical protein
MAELELESAELLPSRETLHCVRPVGHSGNSFTQIAYGNGNTNQAGLLNVSALNGVLSGNTLVL